MELTEVTPAKSDVLNLNRSRQRAVYYRPIQTKNGTEWVKTTPLPADPYNVSYYFAKGFKAKPPEKEEKATSGDISCPLCDFKTDKIFGLEVHLRKHRKSKEKEETK